MEHKRPSSTMLQAGHSISMGNMIGLGDWAKLRKWKAIVLWKVCHVNQKPLWNVIEISLFEKHSTTRTGAGKVLHTPINQEEHGCSRDIPAPKKLLSTGYTLQKIHWFVKLILIHISCRTQQADIHHHIMLLSLDIAAILQWRNWSSLTTSTIKMDIFCLEKHLPFAHGHTLWHWSDDYFSKVLSLTTRCFTE